MKYPRIATELYQAPWQILPEKYGEIAHAFENARRRGDSQAADDPVGPEGEDFWTGEKRMVHPQIEVSGGVALARVHGVTGKGLSAMAMQCGGFDTGHFRSQLANVRDDMSVRALVIHFETPGGMAAGNAQVGQAIREVAASGKKVYGFTTGMCCSAGYWMAAACDEFHAEPDAMVGSISTIYAGVDSSENWKKEGYELKLFATGKFKATGMDGKEWTKEEEDYIWGRIRLIDAEFKGFVSERRGIAAENMEGQWWYAKHAPAGLVDSTSFNDLGQFMEAVYTSII
jgi:signal peptide peptidase SppA